MLASENILCMKEYEIMPNDRATSISNRNFNGARRGGGNNNIGIQSNTANLGAMKGSTVRALNRDGGRQEEKKETKLYISNLDKNVPVGDIRELFGRFGHLRRSTLHHDENGRSQGTAEVDYGSREEALRAMESYNGVPLDNKSMNIEIVGDSAAADDGRVSVFQCLGRVVQNDRNNNAIS